MRRGSSSGSSPREREAVSRKTNRLHLPRDGVGERQVAGRLLCFLGRVGVGEYGYGDDPQQEENGHRKRSDRNPNGSHKQFHLSLTTRVCKR